MKNALLILVCVLIVAVGAAAQDADARLVSSPPFTLSDAATAARIEGNLKVNLTVDKSGSVKHVQIWSIPAFPCGTNPQKEVKEVLDAVKQNVLASRFSPAMKNGKSHDSEMIMTFIVGKTYRNIVTQKGLESIATLEGAPPRFVELGKLNGRATYLPKPEIPDLVWHAGALGSVLTQVLIDEKGNVISVGIIYGDEKLVPPVRTAACAAKFTPLIIKGQPVQVSGVMEYQFERAPYIPKINTNP